MQRNQLFFRDEVVYEPERDATGDSFAFTMYSDGIRELTFHQGLTQADLSFFLDALWGTSVRDTGSEEGQNDDDDDDIVTRLWAKIFPPSPWLPQKNWSDPPDSEAMNSNCRLRAI